MGPVEQSIAKQAFRNGDPMPERIANAPQLITGLQLYIHAFFDLDSERQTGFSAGRIPWRAIKDYAMAFEFDARQTENLIYFIRAMDGEFLKWNNEKNSSD